MDGLVDPVLITEFSRDPIPDKLIPTSISLATHFGSICRRPALLEAKTKKIRPLPREIIRANPVLWGDPGG
jgi:hypothetical protein